jgi:hypothetical protein
MEIDTITGLPVEDNAEILSVMFKINDISLAENVYVLIGTAEDSGDVLSISALITQVDGIEYLMYGDESYEITDNVVEAQISLNETQFDSYTQITVFVSDSQEQETEHLVFTK